MNGSAPSKSTIKRRLRELRALCEDKTADPIARRVAWESEQAIRWATEDTTGWPKPADSARDTAKLIRQEMQNAGGQRTAVAGTLHRPCSTGGGT